MRAVAFVAVFVAVVFALRFAVRGGPASADPTTALPTTSAPPPDVRADPDWVMVDIEGVPPNARLRLDGLPGATTPLRLRRGSRHVLEINAPGYVVRQIQIRADANQRLRADLRPEIGTGQQR